MMMMNGMNDECMSIVHLLYSANTLWREVHLLPKLFLLEFEQPNHEQGHATFRVDDLTLFLFIDSSAFQTIGQLPCLGRKNHPDVSKGQERGFLRVNVWPSHITLT